MVQETGDVYKRQLLYNLAELQNDCSKMFKISPDETLKVVQELYEKKMVTYPRTDARVLSTAVSKEIQKNIGGLKNYGPMAGFADEVLNMGSDVYKRQDKDTNFTGADTRNGMTAVIAVKHPDPIFEGQTKTKLASADATKAVFTVTGDELQLYFDRNVEVLKGVIGCAEKSAKIRRAEEKAKTNMLTKSKFSFDSRCV